MSITNKPLSRFLSIFLIGAMIVSGLGLPSEAESASRPSVKLTAPSAKKFFCKTGFRYHPYSLVGEVST